MNQSKTKTVNISITLEVLASVSDREIQDYTTQALITFYRMHYKAHPSYIVGSRINKVLETKVTSS